MGLYGQFRRSKCRTVKIQQSGNFTIGHQDTLDIGLLRFRAIRHGYLCGNYLRFAWSRRSLGFGYIPELELGGESPYLGSLKPPFNLCRIALGNRKQSQTDRG
jgi:hypothetical protein